MNLRFLSSTAMAAFATLAAPALAGDPDLILYNGALLTMDPDAPQASAIAITGTRISAVGDDAGVRATAGKDTRQIDLSGKTVIPGLVDTHIHAIRGGQTYRFETHWFDNPTLAGAIGELRQAAAERWAGEWVAVVGSWIPEQFSEQRPPSVAELTAALPDNPAYVQSLYDYALLNAKGIEALGLNRPDLALPHGIEVERDASGQATGKILGNVGSFNVFLNQVAPLDAQQRAASLREFFTALNGFGVTGVIDPSAGPAAAYEPVLQMDHDGTLTLRVGYRIPAMAPGSEPDWIEKVMAFRQPHYDTGMISFVGLGESLVAEMNDGVQMGPGFESPPEAKARLHQVAEFAAARSIPVEFHAYTDDAASDILDVFEEVAKTHPIKDLRWSLAHLNTGSPRTIARMAALGMAFSVQIGPYFEGPAILRANGPEVAGHAPPTRAALDAGLRVAGGTDATRIGVFGVWQAIEYQVTGTSLGGAIQKPEDQRLTREEALRLYTSDAAWIGFVDDRRGTLSIGKQADLAVLDQPYLTMPAEQIDTIRATMTLVDGKIVHERQD